MRLLIAVLCMLPSALAAQPIPTPEWINVWSDDVTFNARPAPPGSVIHAYDPDGVLCGEFVVSTPGSYGLMPVYRDDPFSPLVDEGAEPGDAIAFEVDGVPAIAIGPDDAEWTFNGEVKNIDVACQQVIPTAEWVSFWSDATTVGGAPVPPGAVIRAYDADGALCGEFTVSTPGGYGLMPVYSDDPFTPLVDEGAQPGDVIRFAIDDVVAITLGPDAPIWGSNGQIKRVDLDVPDATTGIGPATIRLVLYPNTPNPFGSFTSFDIEITGSAPVDVTIYDVRGRTVRLLVRDKQYNGTSHRLEWDGRNDRGERAPMGVYFVELREGQKRLVRKMCLVR